MPGGERYDEAGPAFALLGGWETIAKTYWVVCYRCGRALSHARYPQPTKTYEHGIKAVVIEFDRLAQATAATIVPRIRLQLAALGNGAERDLRIVEDRRLKRYPTMTGTSAAKLMRRKGSRRTSSSPTHDAMISIGHEQVVVIMRTVHARLRN